MRRILVVCALVVCLGGVGRSWGQVPMRATPSPSLREQVLDVNGPSSMPPDSAGPRPSLGSKSPALAMGLSAIVPGAGQVYAHRYWTIPIIYGFGALFVYNWNEADKLYQQYRRDYQQSVEDGDYGGLGDPNLKSTRDFYRNERDRFGVYLLLTYLLNIADAYVGASLYAFDVSEDLGPAQELRVRISLPFR